MTPDELDQEIMHGMSELEMRAVLLQLASDQPEATASAADRVLKKTRGFN